MGVRNGHLTPAGSPNRGKNRLFDPATIRARKDGHVGPVDAGHRAAAEQRGTK